MLVVIANTPRNRHNILLNTQSLLHSTLVSVSSFIATTLYTAVLIDLNNLYSFTHDLCTVALFLESGDRTAKFPSQLLLP